MVPGRLRRRLPARRRPLHPRRHGHHDPARRRQHDRRRRPPDGRDRRPPRRRSPSSRRTSRSTSSPTSSPGSSSATSCSTRRSRSARPRPSPTRFPCCPSARTARWSSSTTDGRPVGVVTEPDCAGVDRFTQLRQVMSTDLLTCRADIDPREAFDLLDDRPAPHRAGRRRRRAGWSASSPARARCARRSTARRSTRRAGCGSPRRSASTATSRARPQRCSTPGVDTLVVDTAHGHQEPMIAALRAVRALDPQRADRRGQRRHRRGRTGPGRRRRRHHQGRRRAGRHVHHPHDDRRRPAAVLRGAGVRRRRPRAGQARLGRRRRTPPARRRAGAGRRRVQRDDRLLVRRHVRVAGRPPHRRRRPPLQGVLRHGLGARGQRPHRRGAAYDRARKALFEEGISTARMFLDPARPGRRGPDRRDRRRRAQRLHLRRRRRPWRSSPSRRWSACRARPVTPRASRCRQLVHLSRRRRTAGG